MAGGAGDADAPKMPTPAWDRPTWLHGPELSALTGRPLYAGRCCGVRVPAGSSRWRRMNLPPRPTSPCHPACHPSPSLSPPSSLSSPTPPLVIRAQALPLWSQLPLHSPDPHHTSLWPSPLQPLPHGHIPSVLQPLPPQLLPCHLHRQPLTSLHPHLLGQRTPVCCPSPPCPIPKGWRALVTKRYIPSDPQPPQSGIVLLSCSFSLPITRCRGPLTLPWLTRVLGTLKSGLRRERRDAGEEGAPWLSGEMLEMPAVLPEVRSVTEAGAEATRCVVWPHSHKGSARRRPGRTAGVGAAWLEGSWDGLRGPGRSLGRWTGARGTVLLWCWPRVWPPHAWRGSLLVGSVLPPSSKSTSPGPPVRGSARRIRIGRSWTSAHCCSHPRLYGRTLRLGEGPAQSFAAPGRSLG